MTDVGIGPAPPPPLPPPLQPLPFCEYDADEVDVESFGRLVMLNTCSFVGNDAIT